VQKFNGYDLLRHEGQLVALFGVSDGGLVKIPLSKGTEKTLFAVFDETPFYGESGGQVGDRGTISGNGFEGRVVDAQKPVPNWVVLELNEFRGTLEVGKRYAQWVSEEQRQLTARNHTATHLLHWALREVLG